MRRALPWLTVGLLVLGVSAGAGLGISGQSSTPVTPSATQQIDRIVAATLRAQTARFTYSDTTASSNRLLRSTDEGSGQIDFGHDTMRADERERSTDFSGTGATTTKAVAQDTEIDNIWIGRTEYMRFRPETSLDLQSPWLKGVTWPKSSFGPLGALGRIGPLGTLALDESVPGFRVEDAGTGVVNGVETTQYRVVVPLCGASPPLDGITESMAPLQLWVDDQGRLVQARLSNIEDITKKARLGGQFPGAGLLTGRTTTVSVVDLGDFGIRTAITAPTVLNTHSSGGSAFMTLKRAHCR
jgi:hypothetical protein